MNEDSKEHPRFDIGYRLFIKGFCAYIVIPGTVDVKTITIPLDKLLLSPRFYIYQSDHKYYISIYKHI